MMDWKRLDAAVTSLLYPSGLACLACGVPVFGPQLCKACQEELAALRISGDICPDCGGLLEEDGSCHRCTKYGRILARSVWPYHGAASKLVRMLKDEAVSEASIPLCQGIAECIGTLQLQEEPVLTWVPMPANRYNVRGIDHGRILAEGTAGLLSLPCKSLLKRSSRDGHTQRGLNAEERRKNLAHAFCCDQVLSGTVLIIDDVLTTGATADACTAVLQKAGADRVIVITATRA